MTVRRHILVETVNELDVDDYKAHYDLLKAQYDDMTGNYIIYDGQDSSEFVQWEVYKIE